MVTTCWGWRLVWLRIQCRCHPTTTTTTTTMTVCECFFSTNQPGIKKHRAHSTHDTHKTKEQKSQTRNGFWGTTETVARPKQSVVHRPSHPLYSSGIPLRRLGGTVAGNASRFSATTCSSAPRTLLCLALAQLENERARRADAYEEWGGGHEKWRFRQCRHKPMSGNKTPRDVHVLTNTKTRAMTPALVTSTSNPTFQVFRQQHSQAQLAVRPQLTVR